MAQDNQLWYGIAGKPTRSTFWVTGEGNIPDPIFGIFKSREKFISGFGLEAFVRYPLSPKVTFRTGLGYTKNGSQYPKTEALWGMPDSTLPIAFQAQFIHQDIVLPIVLNWNFYKKGKHQLFLSGGLTNAYNFSRTFKFIQWFENSSTKDITRPDTSGIRRFNVNLNVGFGYEYFIKNNILLFLNPSFDMNLLSIHTPAPIQRRMLLLGATVGICLKP